MHLCRLLTAAPLLFAAVLLPSQVAPATPATPATTAARAPFAPREHGFRFANTFQNDAVPVLDLRTSGLCGGMAYAALDYWLAGMPIPQQDYRPANGTPLQRYVYARQVDSLLPNGTRWLAYFADVRGVRRTEFFRQGLDRGESGELGKLRKMLAEGAPAPLGLRAPGRTGHQVLALGCEAGANEQDLAIRLYDPNFPDRVMTMVPDLERQLYVYAGGPERVQWAAWFVDAHYAPKVPTVAADPPWPQDGLVHELLVECTLGKRGLAGHGEDLDVTLQFAGGRSATFRAVNQGARWLGDYRETARVVLAEPVPARDLRGLELRLAAAGKGSCDLQKVRVRGLGGGLRVVLGEVKGSALSPDAPAQVVPFAAK
ncbi:MAG: hypothetical protein FJ265_07290 [Planctomycetes bacterium]|nr:hypothetical protein [Planctomycetota bacterium]